jgi:hypothetical protein
VKIAITGLSNSGKTTVFNALTGLNLETPPYPSVGASVKEPHIGVVKVPDKRLDHLCSLYKEKKCIHATIEFLDYAGIIIAGSGGDHSHNTSVFEFIKEADAILHVVRGFSDDSVPHPMQSLDPIRDIKSFEAELILGDLELIEKRIERINLSTKKGLTKGEEDKLLLAKCKEALEHEQPLKSISFTEQEKRLMLSYQFMTTKPEIILINTGEEGLKAEQSRKAGWKHDTISYFKNISPECIPPVISLCGKLEMEISQLPESERQEFIKGLDIGESAIDRLCRVSYETLKLISFFTIGKNEIKAWTISKGTEALKAAGKVHSDMERGFIRAEVVHFDDFISVNGDMTKAREKVLSGSRERPIL